MKPWVVDAKDIEPEDLDQFSGQLLHLNNQIADFLDPSTTEEVLVIAPKGFGKTLLLKAKRQSMRERYGTMLPERALVDKPSANPDLMSHREYGSMRETEAYWKALWSIALTLAVEKHLGVCPELGRPAREAGAQRAPAQRLRSVHQPPRPAARRLFRRVQGLRRASAAGVPAHPQLDRHVRRQHRRVLRGLPRQRPGRQRGAARDLSQLLALRAGRHRARRARPARDQQPRQDLRLDPQGGVPAHLPRQSAWACSSPAPRSTCSTRARTCSRSSARTSRSSASATSSSRRPGIPGCASSASTPPGSCTRAPATRRSRRVLDPPHLPPAARHRVHRPRPRGDRPAPAHARGRPPADHAQRRRDRAGLHHRDVAASAAVRPRDPVPPDPPQRGPARRARGAVRASTTGCSRPGRAAARRSPATSSPACSRSGCSATSASTPRPPSWSSTSAIPARCRSTATTSCRTPSSS